MKPIPSPMPPHHPLPVRPGPSRGPRGGRLRAWWTAAVALAALFIVPACTGSGTTPAPIVLFAAGDDGGTATVRAFETLLPPDPLASEQPLAERPGLQRTLAGSRIVDVVTVRDARPALYLLLRDADGADEADRTERLVRYDLASLDPSDAASLPNDPETVLADLDALLVDLDVLAGDDPLCATGMTVAGDASWLGLLHDPRACLPASSDPPVVIALEIAPADPSQRRFGPPGLGTADVAAIPTFFGVGDDARLAWVRATGAVWAWSPFVDGDVEQELGRIDLTGSAAAIGRSSTGVAVASGDDVRFVSAAGDEPGPVWTVDGAGTIGSVVDAEPLPGTATLLLGTDRLALIGDLDQEADDERIETATVAADAAAVIGPYGFAFVATGGELRAYDALSASIDDGALGGPVARRDLGSLDVRSLDWAFTVPSDDVGSVP